MVTLLSGHLGGMPLGTSMRNVYIKSLRVYLRDCLNYVNCGGTICWADHAGL